MTGALISALPAAVSALAAVAVAVIEAVNIKSRRRTEARAARRERAERLSMELMGATCSLALITAKKVAGMHTNGDVAAAMAEAAQAHERYMEFIEDIAAKAVTRI